MMGEIIARRPGVSSWETRCNQPIDDVRNAARTEYN